MKNCICYFSKFLSFLFIIFQFFVIRLVKLGLSFVFLISIGFWQIEAATTLNITDDEALKQFNAAAGKQYPDLIVDGEVHPALVEIATILFGDDIPKDKRDLNAWNDFMQKNFLRPPGDDHQQAQKQGHHPKHNELLQHFKALGLIDAIMPNGKDFGLVVIFGGSPWDTLERFEWARSLGTSDRRFIYINGERELQTCEIEWLASKGLTGITYQHEAAKALWNSLNANQEVQPLSFITVPKPEGRRANTEDTLEQFLSYARHETGKILFITNGPYGPYQLTTAAKVIGNRLIFEGSCSATPDTMSTVSLLDTIARWFYTTFKMRAITNLY